MPKIQVNERDLSWYFRQRDPGQLVVLMPVVSTWGPTDRPVLADDSNFSALLGSDIVSSEDLSYPMAASIVRTGAQVLAWRIPLTGAETAQSSKVPAEGGEGDDVTPGTADYIRATVKENEYKYFRVFAKYPGSFGNKIEVSLQGLDYGNRTISVVIDDIVVESLIYNFTDPSSRYYYTSVVEDSEFITIEEDTETENITASTPSVIKLSGGTDGSYSKDSVAQSIVNAMNSGDSVFADLKDPYMYDFNIIMNGGYNNIETMNTISVIDDQFTELATSRGTAIYLVDGKPDWSASEIYTYTGLPDPMGSSQVAGFNTSYAACFGPWCNAQLLSTGAYRQLPGSYVMVVAWGMSLAQGNPLWLSPAGVKRSSLGSLVKSTDIRVGSAVLDMWQNHERMANRNAPSVHGVNPIMRLKQYGYVIYGNSTLLQNRYDGATSMLQSFNVRVTANMIKSQAFNVSMYLQFDQLDSDLFAQFKVLLGEFMDQLKFNHAIYDYRIIADYSKLSLDDLNARTVPVTIQISPTPAAENFVITLEVSQAGITFGDDSEFVEED